jgi:hypothetical protein
MPGPTKEILGLREKPTCRLELLAGLLAQKEGKSLDGRLSGYSTL